jgi:hypothetical protein
MPRNAHSRVASGIDYWVVLDSKNLNFGYEFGQTFHGSSLRAFFAKQSKIAAIPSRMRLPRRKNGTCGSQRRDHLILSELF